MSIDFVAFYGLIPGKFTVEIAEDRSIRVSGDDGEVTIADGEWSATARGTAPFAFLARGMARVEPPALTAQASPHGPPAASTEPVLRVETTAAEPSMACPKCGHGPPHRPHVPGAPMLYCIPCGNSWDP